MYFVVDVTVKFEEQHRQIHMLRQELPDEITANALASLTPRMPIVSGR